MDNTLAKYLGKNMIGAISSVNVVQGTAKETGNVYYAVELTFINGYKNRIFLRGAEQFAWVNAFEMAETQKQVDAAF